MIVPARFEPVRRVFEDQLNDELGARFTLVIDGEVALDLWGGFSDRARTRPFDERTLTPVFSTTKAIAATLVAGLVDRGGLDYEQPVASVWPAFGAAGKAGITIGQALSHQAGLAGFPDPMQPELWFDWDAICARLAAMVPLWPPGTASGYHPVTWGYIAGEIFRRADGRTMGAALREDLAEPFGLDLWIGLPEAEFGRVAGVEKPKRMPDFSGVDAIKRAAFLEPWSSPGGRGTAAWRSAEIPSANGHATAEGLARLMGALADGGRLRGAAILSPQTIAAASRERIRGRDRVLPFEVAWGAGFLLNDPIAAYGPNLSAFGHSGWGGSCAFADPDRRLGCAYVMNSQSHHLVGDPRAKRLIETTYACL